MLERCFDVWEARDNGNRIRYLLGMEKSHQSKIKQAMEPHGKIQFHKPEEERVPVTNAVQLKISKARRFPHRWQPGRLST